MTDRELLELAAKAAGEITPSWYGNANYFDGVLQRWNPLTDDGGCAKVGGEVGTGHHDAEGSRWRIRWNARPKRIRQR